MTSSYIDSIKILENGWKQGACLEIDTAETIKDINGNFLKAGLYLVITQDCNLVNDNLEKEPYVEVLCLESIQKINGSNTNSKNPRILHISLECSDETKNYEINIHKKFYLSRAILLEYSSYKRVVLQDRHLSILKTFLTNRYVKTAFPDEFNRRWQPHVKKLLRILDEYCLNALGLYVRLNSNKELQSDQEYKMMLFILISPEIEENSVEETKINLGLEKIIELFEEKIPGIKIIHNKVLSTKQMTLHQWSELKKWDWDYITHSSEEESPILLSH